VRNTHPTLNCTEPIKILEISTMFYNLNKNLLFDQSLLDRYKIDDFLCLRFTDEGVEIPEGVAEKVENYVRSFRGVGKG
jgi:hypothetical protein